MFCSQLECGHCVVCLAVRLRKTVPCISVSPLEKLGNQLHFWKHMAFPGLAKEPKKTPYHTISFPLML